jgi:hypothetical protein
MCGISGLLKKPETRGKGKKTKAKKPTKKMRGKKKENQKNQKLSTIFQTCPSTPLIKKHVLLL